MKRVKLQSKPVKTNGTIASAIESYRKLNLPMRKLLTDYLIVLSKYSELKAALNPWRDYHIGKVRGRIETGVSVEETALEFAAMNLKKQLPTDVIRSAYYSAKDRNDSGIECSFLVPKFLESVDSEKEILVVNPSPDMLIMVEEGRKGCKNYYIVTDRTIADLYKHQFAESTFFAIDEIREEIVADEMLIINRDFPVERTAELMRWIEKCVGKVYAFIPHSFLENDEMGAFKLFEKAGMNISSILLIPSSAYVSMPRKKCLVALAKEYEGDILLKKADYIETEKVLEIPDNSYAISKLDFWKRDISLISCWNMLIKKECEETAIEKYDKSLIYQFSKEIELAYSIYANKDNRYAGKAWYRELLNADTQKRGKRITPIIEKGLRAKTEEEIVKELWQVVFDERVYPYIHLEIKEKYIQTGKAISLKTLWFLCKPIMVQKADYDEIMMQELFINAEPLGSFLADEQTDIECIALLSKTIGIDKVEIPTTYFNQVNLVFECAKKNGYIKTNPLADIMRSVRNRASDRQNDIRQIMSKKHFTDKEEMKIFDFLCETVIWHGEEYRRCVVDSMALAALIRLFTGMATREVCALYWSDFKEIDGAKEYQFNVVKYCDKDGKVVSYSSQEIWKRFRLVPITKPLQVILLQRRDYLKELGYHETELLEMPIICARDIYRYEFGLKRLAKPAKVAEFCRELLKVAEIPEQILVLPDSEKELVTDIYKYNGDIFLSNIRMHLNHDCKFSIGESNSMVGMEGIDTFSRHYCDYSHDLIQYGMIHKMCRWSSKYESKLLGTRRGSPGFKKISQSGEIKSPNFIDHCAMMEFEICSKDMELQNIEMEVDCEFGVNVEIRTYGGVV